MMPGRRGSAVNLANVLERPDDDDLAPGVPALVADGRRWTYGEVRLDAGRTRAALTAAGVGPGDVVALLAGISPAFVTAYHGILAAGAVAAPLNPLAPEAELARELAVLRPAALLVGPAARPVVAGLGDEALDGVPVLDVAGEVAAFAPDLSPPVDRAADDPAVLLFTSGTAGTPRPAVLTHGNLAVNRRQVIAQLGDLVGPGAVSLCALPLFHVFALNSILGVTLAVGGTVVLQPRFDPVAALAAVGEHGVTMLVGAPPMWAAFAALTDDELAPLRGLRVAASGAAPLPRTVAERLLAAGVRVQEGYGLTEASPGVCMATGTDAPIGSVGPPLPGVEVRLVDDRGDDVLVGDEGEVWVRGPNVFAGYLDDPDATRAVRTDDGWLRTGDLAVVDEQGNVSIVGRLKELVIVSGFNVAPREVEEVLLEAAGVAAAVAYGVPHPHTGEAVHADVVADDGAAIDTDLLLAHCERHLARYKCPVSIQVVPSLPVGVTGKRLRPGG
jgi:long-chain acyl-CoA synthetase